MAAVTADKELLSLGTQAGDRSEGALLSPPDHERDWNQD